VSKRGRGKAIEAILEGYQKRLKRGSLFGKPRQGKGSLPAFQIGFMGGFYSKVFILYYLAMRNLSLFSWKYIRP
jgi:hypothetical protein